MSGTGGCRREADLRDWLVNAGMSHERRILRLPIGG
jgi:tRNA pseudouridine13 synthase